MEEALSRAQDMGIALNSQNFQEKSGEVCNFGVYKYGRNNKASKCILQIDFQESMLCLLKRGLRQRSYQFDSIENIDTVDDSTRIIIQFENGSYLEVEAGSLEEKNQISRLLLSIINQDQLDLPLLSSFFIKREKIILEGVLEKKGHSAAFLMWTKRFVKVLPGEIMYFKVGDQDNESSALNIIPLKLGDVVLKKQVDSGFSLLSKDKEYSFRICPSKNNDIEKERDSWLVAIQEALKTSSNQSEEGITDIVGQRKLFKNAIISLNVQLEQLGTILQTTEAPVQVYEHLKKIQKNVLSMSEQTKTKLFWNVDDESRDESINRKKEKDLDKEDLSHFYEDASLLRKQLQFNNTTPDASIPTVSIPTPPPFIAPNAPLLKIPTAPPLNVPTPPSLNVPTPPPLNIPNAPTLKVPAPPAIGGVATNLPSKSNVVPTCKMKQLFWSKIPDTQITKSFWIDSQDKTNSLNLKKLEKMFQLGQQSEKKDVKKAGDVDLTKTQSMSLLDQRKAQNLGIFLSGFKLNDINIDAKLTILGKNEGFTSEEIVGLKRFQPTVDEMEMYKLFKGDISKLTDVDKFMIKLCNIPNLGSRLDILLTMRELPDEIENMQVSLQNLMDACLCLHENKHFIRLLEYVLALGNYMNSGTSRGAAYGFKLSVLNKLIDIRSSDAKYTLLDFIVDELWFADHDAITCYKDMRALLNPIDFSLKNLFAEFQIMEKELQCLKEKVKGIESDIGENVCRSIKKFFENHSKTISDLGIMCQKIEDLYTSLKNKFGESSSINFETWLSEIGSFIKYLQTAVESAERRYGNTYLSDPTKPKEECVVESLNEESKETTNLTQMETFNDQVLSSSHNSQKSDHVKNDDKKKNAQAVILEFKKVFSQKEVSDNTPEPELKTQNLKENFNDICGEELKEKCMSGFLEKLSGGKKRAPKWDRRYFELTDNGYLQYFKKKGGKISGTIFLKGCPVSINQTDNCIINILQEDREWKIKGDNADITAEWLNLCLFHAKKD